MVFRERQGQIESEGHRAHVSGTHGLAQGPKD